MLRLSVHQSFLWFTVNVVMQFQFRVLLPLLVSFIPITVSCQVHIVSLQTSTYAATQTGF